MRKNRSEDSKDYVSRMVTKNMLDLVEEEQLQSRRLSTQDRMANRLVSFAGTPLFFWIHIILFGTWLSWNTHGAATHVLCDEG